MYELPLGLYQLAHWIGLHGFEYTIDTESRCIRVEIPCTRYGKPSKPLIETVRNMREARSALGY